MRKNTQNVQKTQITQKLDKLMTNILLSCDDIRDFEFQITSMGFFLITF